MASSMTRADWLNLIQVGLFFSQGLNLLLLMWHANIYITGISGLFIQSATFYLHLMGLKTDPITGQNPLLPPTEPSAK